MWWCCGYCYFQGSDRSRVWTLLVGLAEFRQLPLGLRFPGHNNHYHQGNGRQQQGSGKEIMRAVQERNQKTTLPLCISRSLILTLLDRSENGVPGPM
jgi:hypothetical protein